MPTSLFRSVLTFSNLLEAWLKVRANKGCAGVDGITIDDFGRSLQTNLTELQREVLRGSYCPQALLRVLTEPPGKKPRYLAIPTVRDRVLQTAVSLVLAPIFEVEFEDCSFGYRQGRSVKLAVERVMRYRREGFHWVVDADISAFFDEIDHALLLKEVRKIVSDPRLLTLIELWMKAEVTEDGKSWRLAKGVPQGSPISPYLANLYLDHLDEAVLRENLRLVRYADDFLILCKSRNEAEDALELTEDVLERLRLRLNSVKTRIVNFDQGFRFLGVRFIRSLAVESHYDDDPVSLPSADAPTPHQPAFMADMSALPGVKSKPQQSRTEETEPNGDGLPQRTTDAMHTGSEAIKAPQPETSSPATAMRAAFACASGALTTPEDDRPVERIVPDAESDEANSAVPVLPHDAADRPREPLLRTLYVVEPGCILSRESERLVLRKEGEVLQEIPALKVDLVMVFGNSQITVQAMRLCLEQQIPIALLSQSGRFLGMVDAFDTDAVLLHRAQFERAADPDFALRLAKGYVSGKVDNSRLVLRRYARHHPTPRVEALQQSMGEFSRQAKGAQTLDELRGFEGAAAKKHFEGLGLLLPAEWDFRGRKKQPPPDPINALLSYGYTLLFHNVYALLRARGLNPHVGYLHPARPGHPALVSDLMEEFRSLLVDALVLSLALRRRIAPTDFDLSPDSDVRCTIRADTRKLFIHAFEAKMGETLTHPLTAERLDYRRAIDAQVRQLAAVIRGTQAEYVPMVLR